MLEHRAEIMDMFSSMQGEGIFLGAKQIFIRFKRCNLNCAFCDEDRSLEAKEYTADEIMKNVRFLELNKGPHHSVSLTGGEPLIYSGFLVTLLEMLRAEGFKSYLETNGTLPAELSKVVGLVDIIAMDFKLPSSTREREYWDEHLEFLKIASARKVFVKAVVTPDTLEGDIAKALDLIKKVNENIPLIIQPVSPVKESDKNVESGRLLDFLAMASGRKMENVRIIPQIHKKLGMK